MITADIQLLLNIIVLLVLCLVAFDNHMHRKEIRRLRDINAILVEAIANRMENVERVDLYEIKETE